MINRLLTVEQSIGRGLRLPCGKRVGVTAVDRLNIVAHDKFQEIVAKPDIAAIVKKTVELIVQQTIDIPRILVVPKGEVESGFHSFELELSGLTYQPISDELWVQFLRTDITEVIGLGKGGIKEKRLENYVVSGLVDFDDIRRRSQPCSTRMSSRKRTWPGNGARTLRTTPQNTEASRGSTL